MRRLDELVFPGYEPLPTNQIYKNLKDDHTICSSIIFFERIGDLLAARTSDKDENQVIIFIEEDEVCHQTS